MAPVDGTGTTALFDSWLLVPFLEIHCVPAHCSGLNVEAECPLWELSEDISFFFYFLF